VEKFGPTNGRLPGGLGIAVVVAAAVATLADGWHDSDLLVLTCLALASVLIWLVMFRPTVRSDGTTLEMRNMVSTTWVPLASVRKVLVGAMLMVTAGDVTHRSIAVQRSRRRGRTSDGAGFVSARGGSHQHTVLPLGSIAEQSGNYSDFIEERIKHLAEEARVHRRGLDDGVRRTWAWPEIVATVVLAVAVVVVFFVA
jgi:hypothetical protein